MHSKPHTSESKKKMSLAQKGKKLSDETKFKMMGRIPWNKDGGKYSEQTKKKMSQSRMGKEPWNKGKKGIMTAWNKGLKGYKAGEQHYLYIKDRTKLKIQNRRNDSAYKEWRRSVWLRDNFKCKISNPDCKGRLEAHHILGYAAYPELRYDINNGITLCHAHHPRKRQDEINLSPYFKELVMNSK